MLEKDGGIKKENSSQEPQQLGGLLKKAEGILNLQGDSAFMNGLDVKSEGKAIIVKNGILDGQQCLIGLIMMIKRGGVEHLQHLHRFLASVLGEQCVHGNELLVVGRMATSAHHEQ